MKLSMWFTSLASRPLHVGRPRSLHHSLSFFAQSKPMRLTLKVCNYYRKMLCCNELTFVVMSRIISFPFSHDFSPERQISINSAYSFGPNWVHRFETSKSPTLFLPNDGWSTTVHPISFAFLWSSKASRLSPSRTHASRRSSKCLMKWSLEFSKRKTL